MSADFPTWFILWTNIQRSDTFYKSAVRHGTKTVIQMQTFYSFILNPCKPHQNMTMTVLDIAVLWQSLLLLQRTSISALIFQADEAFNRDKKSFLGMVTVGNYKNLANELFNFIGWIQQNKCLWSDSFLKPLS